MSLSARHSAYRASYAPSVGQPLPGNTTAGPSQARYSRTARESMFPVPSGEYINSLEECVRATEGCVSSLTSALDKLEPGIADFPRLNRIFEIEHGFLLVPEPAVQAKKNAYATSLQPYIDKLLDRSADLVAAEGSRIARLEEQLELLRRAREQRIPAPPKLPGTFKDLDAAEEKSHLDGIDTRSITAAQRRRIGMLRMKRERLEKERARLMG